ncbi:TrkA family potassium uptake protein [Bacillus sp. 31A1R]|uniref:TrkA family potassium uptake protein n=1 Tax=Robertmurraya mangrovi TaxID=3098077 RepID=A0ABU5IWX5_9BACI|nr:TrkA family potassium uptake protein [Bacillus sp. 31A1R]MDZ5471616.1 TrkA family potassium uptake protein [Bacillus sp. 31A1R]
MKKQFAVIGLGRFGGSLVEEFHYLGVDVLAVDRDEEKVERYSKFATHAVQANAINENTLKELGIKNMDHVIVSFGHDIETSILTTLFLKELGVNQVWVKASNIYHQRVLEKIGADRVIHPERDMAKRIAHHVISEKIIDYIELSKDHSIVEIVCSEKLHQRTLQDLDVRAKFGCNIIGIQRGEDIIISPVADERIYKNDILIVIGENRDLHRFEVQGV